MIFSPDFDSERHSHGKKFQVSPLSHHFDKGSKILALNSVTKQNIFTCAETPIFILMSTELNVWRGILV